MSAVSASRSKESDVPGHSKAASQVLSGKGRYRFTENLAAVTASAVVHAKRLWSKWTYRFLAAQVGLAALCKILCTMPAAPMLKPFSFAFSPIRSVPALSSS